MFKKLKNLFNTRDIPKTPRRLLLWMLYVLTFLILQDYENIGVIAQTCSNLKFPLTFGFSSGETEIISIDQDSLTGYIYIAGTSTATELLVSGAKKSIFIALFNG